MNSSTWWDDFLEPAAQDQRAEQTARFKRRLADALSDTGEKDADLQLRRRAAGQLAEIANRVWESCESAGKKRSWAHNAQRLAAGGSAAAAAGSGGALASGLGGTTATVLGIVVIGIGILTGIGAAIWPETEYERNRGKARQYEQLWWNIWDFALLELPAIKTEAIYGKVEEFAAAVKSVGEE
jgi:hypothetical protein